MFVIELYRRIREWIYLLRKLKNDDYVSSKWLHEHKAGERDI